MTQLGIGVLGLHEGRTLLVALNRPDFAPAHVRAVAGCDLRAEKIEAAQRDCPDLFYRNAPYIPMLKHWDIRG